MPEENDPTPRTAELWGPWDTKTQTFHAGQEWRSCPNLVEDFSIDVNALGTPEVGKRVAKEAIKDMVHYPPADFEPALTHLAQFLWPKDWEMNKQRLLLGNGCSELIDLITRCSSRHGGMKPGKYPAQYREMHRAAIAAGFKILSAQDPNATLLGLVNPNTPTGDYMNVSQIKQYIEDNCVTDCYVIVDETSQPWLGPDWRDDSLLSQTEWLADIALRKRVYVFVVHSWSKLWTCAGLRLGSLVAPTVEAYELVKSRQVPWSVNNVGLTFLEAVVHDEEYMKKTWEVHRPWRERAKNFLESTFGWKVYGEPWVPSLWVDVGSESVAVEVLRRSRKAGVPVRPGKPGYEMATFFRMGVRTPELQDVLFEALKPLAKKD